MNNIVKCVMSFIVGAGVGAAGMYFGYLKKKESEYYKELRKAIDEECENLRKSHAEMVNNPNKVKLDDEDADDEEKPIAPVPAHADYDKVLKDYGYISDEDSEEDETSEDEPLMEDCDPYILDQSSWNCLPPKYDIVEWTYLAHDGTLLNEHEEIIDDPDRYIGDCMDQIPMEGQIKYVYILAPRMGLAIEVTIVLSDYRSFVGL